MDIVRILLSEVEFEEIMNRNRVILSSVILRVVFDVSVGLYIFFCINIFYVCC